MEKIKYITIFNYGYLDFVKNNILNYLKIYSSFKNNLTLISLDEESFLSIKEFLNEKSTIYDISNIELKLELLDEDNKFANFNSKEFINIMHKKIILVLKELKLNDKIHFFDSDVVFFKDPTDLILEKLETNDIVFQLDQPFTYHHDLYHNYVCAGNFSVKKNERSINFINNIINRLNPSQNDQETLFTYLNQNCKNIKEYKDCVLDVYDPELVQNGYDAFVGKWYTKNEKFCIHANHMIGKESKLNALKMSGGWFLL